MIDLIERNVENASIWVYQGQREVVRAVRISRSNTKVGMST